MQVFLDDERNHPLKGWIHVRTVPSLMSLIELKGDEITVISFDNDLQQPMEGWEGLRDIVDKRLDNDKFLPSLQEVIVHSANRDARQNMIGRMTAAVRAGVFDVEVTELPATSYSYPLTLDDDKVVEEYKE